MPFSGTSEAPARPQENMQPPYTIAWRSIAAAASVCSLCGRSSISLNSGLTGPISGYRCANQHAVSQSSALCASRKMTTSPVARSAPSRRERGPPIRLGLRIVTTGSGTVEPSSTTMISASGQSCFTLATVARRFSRSFKLEITTEILHAALFIAASIFSLHGGQSVRSACGGAGAFCSLEFALCTFHLSFGQFDSGPATNALSISSHAFESDPGAAQSLRWIPVAGFVLWMCSNSHRTQTCDRLSLMLSSESRSKWARRCRGT